MADTLDSIVKGAPMAVPGRDLPKSVGGTSPILSSSSSSSSPPTAATAGMMTAGKTGDPLSHTPSSPSMIYLNLLILEASLRAQYLELRARRRHHTFFLVLLALWTLSFGYALFLAPREDGKGVGGSVYWMVESTERVCFLGGLMTAMLVWAVGIWERGVRWPRRWFAVSNRGLRGFNCKLVVMKRPWWREALSTLAWFLTYGLFSNNAGGSSYRYVDPSVLRDVDRALNLQGGAGGGGGVGAQQNHPTLPILSEDEERGGHEEDLAPGGDYVKLLLLPKPFSPTFRENWELYRTEYWERENERRALLRAKIRERDRQLRRERGWWFWWLPWRRITALDNSGGNSGSGSGNKMHNMMSEKATHPRHAAVSGGEHRRTRSGSSSGARRGSVSTSSRSPTPTPTPTPTEPDEPAVVSRKASTSSNASDKRRKKGHSGSFRSQNRPRVDSRSITPEKPSPLARESSLSATPTSLTPTTPGGGSATSDTSGGF